MAKKNRPDNDGYGLQRAIDVDTPESKAIRSGDQAALAQPVFDRDQIAEMKAKLLAIAEAHRRRREEGPQPGDDGGGTSGVLASRREGPAPAAVSREELPAAEEEESPFGEDGSVDRSVWVEVRRPEMQSVFSSGRWWDVRTGNTIVSYRKRTPADGEVEFIEELPSLKHQIDAEKAKAKRESLHERATRVVNGDSGAVERYRRNFGAPPAQAQGYPTRDRNLFSCLDPRSE